MSKLRNDGRISKEEYVGKLYKRPPNMPKKGALKSE